MERDQFDVVIVGGGAAGCVVARRLSERGDIRVLLIEAGPDLGDQVGAALRGGWNNPAGGDWSVVDASVIPDAPSGFPHVITIMLAEHLSEALAGLLAGRDHGWGHLPATTASATSFVRVDGRPSE